VDTGRNTLARVPAVLARHLEAADITDAVIRLARRTGDRYENSELLIGNYIGMEYQILSTVWYQVLSEEQLRRVGGPPPGAARLPGGRHEPTVGEPSQWMPGSPDRAIVEEQVSRLLRGDA
jgi:hypothetical protein